MKSSAYLASAMLCIGLPACTLIPVNPGADKVVVSEEGRVAACDAKGNTSVGVLHQVAGIPRLPEVVADDLARVASNDAVNMGGDTIVPLGPVADGRRKFAIYKCRRDEAPRPAAATAPTAPAAAPVTAASPPAGK